MNSTGNESWLKDLQQALMPGAFSGALVVIMSVSFSALIFTGRLSGFVDQGVALAINAAMIVGLITSLFSRCQPVISMADEDTAPVFAVLVAFIVAALPAASAPEEMFATALAAIIVSTIIAGIGLALLGVFQFGEFVQFLPHSVMGGYFAALGWLLIIGGLQVVGGLHLDSLGAYRKLFEWSQLVLWIPAIVVAAWLMVMRDRIPRSRLLPGTVVIAVAAWFLTRYVSGSTPDHAMHDGLLVGPFASDSGTLLNPLAGLSFSGVQWSQIAMNSGSIATIFLIAIMSMLLGISGLGYLTRTEPDMNKELKIAGLANVASGLGGGMMGLPSYSLSSLAIDMGAKRNRWTGLVTVLVCILIFVFALPLVAYTPKFVLSGILIYLGLHFMNEWLLEGRHKFSLLEYLVIPVILLASVFAGFLQGIITGLVMAIVLFVVKYSRIKVIRYAVSGAEIMSNVDRQASAQSYLKEHGPKTMVLGLQGYLFFGTAGKIFKQVKQRLEDEALPELKNLVIDFGHVTGLDASAALNFQKMARLSDGKGFNLLIAGLNPLLLERLKKGGFGQVGEVKLIYQPDLDHAMEWLEDDVLKDSTGLQDETGFFEQLGQYLSEAEIEILFEYLERREVQAGEVLASQGDKSDEMYFMETCPASAYITGENGQVHRVRHSTRGTVFGELGFYLRVSRTASVVTDQAGLIFVLNQKALQRMEDEHPEVASGLHRYMANLLSERLLFTTRTLKAILM